MTIEEFIRPYSFFRGNALKYGVREAIFINYFREETKNKRARGAKGTVWLTHTFDSFEKYFPFMTIDQIRTTLGNLIKKGAVSKKYNGINPCDRTPAYALTEDYLKGVIL